MATINGTNGNDTIRTAAAGGSLGGLANATDVADTITGLDGADTIVAGAGNDTITGGAGADTLNGGADNDTFVTTLAELAGDVIDGGDGTDTLEISNNQVAIDITSVSFTNLETLRLGGGNTLTANIAQLNALSSIVGFFNFGVNSTLVLANPGTVDLTGKLTSIGTVTGTSGDDTITADVSTLNGLGGNDTLTGGNSANTINGGTGTDTLNGLGGADTLNGNEDADTINGGAGNDTITGGAGADTLNGGLDNDTFVTTLAELAGDVIDGGDGTDTLEISNNQVAIDLTGLSFTNLETLRLGGGNTLTANIAQLNALSSIVGFFNFGVNSTLVLANPGTVDLTGKLTSIGTVTGTSGDDTITADVSTLNGLGGNDTLTGGNSANTINGGTGTDTLNGLGGADTLNGNEDADTINGGAGNDTITGGTGADTLNGGADNDTFVATLAELAGDVIDGGDGTDTLEISNNQVAIDLTGLSFTNLETLRLGGGNTLTANIAQLNALSSIVGFFNFGVNSTLVLANPGTVDLTGKLTSIGTVTGTSGDDTITADVSTLNGLGGNDTLTGGNSANTINGGTGTDTLNGLGGADTLNGNEDADTINGGAGNDTITGGTGADTLNGGADNDTFVATLAELAGDVIDGGDGSDTLEISNNQVAIDITGLSFTNLEIIRVGGGNSVTATTAQLNALSSLVGFFNFGVSSTITLANTGTVDLTGKLSSISTVTGTSGNDTITADVSTLNGLGGNDTLTGGNSGNVINGGAGDDVLDGLGSGDTLNGGDDNDTLLGGAGFDTLNGDAGNDTLEGGADNDTLTGGTGTDILRGGTGNDTYVLTAADLATDTIEELAGEGTDQLDITTNNVAIDLTGVNVGNFETLRLGGGNALTATTAQLNGLSSIVGFFNFGVSSTITLANTGTVDLTGKLSSISTVTGTSGNDTITADVSTLNGLGGNDTLTGGNSGNTINGGAGDDVLDGLGSGDTLNGGDDNDTLLGGAGFDTLNGDAGNDILEGGADNDTLTGGAGTDILRGGTGNDTYVLNTADLATDTIEELAGEGTDQLDITTNNVAIDLTGVNVANIETLRLGGGNALTATTAQLNGLSSIVGFFNFGVSSTITLANTGTVDLTGKLSSISAVTGTSGNDTITADVSTLNGLGGNDTLTGGASGNVINGGAGDDVLDGLGSGDTLNGGEDNDTLQGGAGFDTLNGDAGNDTLEGGADNDTLTGGTGTDILRGGTGNDTYVLTAADLGTDTIEELAGEGTDQVDITTNSVALNISAFNTANIETLRLGGNNVLTATVEQLNALSSINGFFNFGVNSTITLANAGVVDLTGKLVNISTVNGSAGNDTITAEISIINGLGGDDTFRNVSNASGFTTYAGGSGRDVYVLGTNAMAGGSTADAVSDFVVADDRIRITALLETFANYVIGSDPFASGHARFQVSGNSAALQLDSDGSAGPAAFRTVLTLTNLANPASATSAVVFNQVPNTGNDSFSVAEDNVLTVTAPGVLVNDSDPNIDPLEAVLVSGPTNGSLTLNANGSFTYTPNANFFGADSFTYRPTDGELQGAVGTVSLTVTPVNDAPSDIALGNASVAENSPFGTVVGALSAIDIDDLAGALSFSVIGGGPFGISGTNLVVTGALNFEATPTRDVTIRVTDAAGLFHEETFTITIQDVNEAPVAAVDSYSLAEDGTLTVGVATGVLANDTDPDGDTLAAEVLTNPANGTLTLNQNGSFTYVPNANFFGADSFVYVPSDGELEGAPALVNITVNPVNDAPSDIILSNLSVAENSGPGTVVGSLSALDVDDAAGALTFTVLGTSPFFFGLTGTNLVVSGSLDFETTPTRDVTIRVTDAAGLFRDETFTINILNVNEAPIAVGDSYVATEDTALVVPVGTGVLANDTDVDSTALSAQVVTGPANGTLALNGNGSFTYTPNANFSGPDSFTYRVSDGSLQSFATTVQIGVLPVNDLPTAVNDSFAGTEDLAITGNVTGNDIDVDGPLLTTALVAGPANGTLALNPLNGSFTYTPNANFNGTDSFTYTLSDGLATSAPATVTLTLAAADDPPVAVADVVAGTQDTTLSIPLANLLANDTHADGAAALAGTTVTAVSAPAAGIASVSIVGGQVQVVPVAGFSGGTGFTYTITDADGDTANGAVTVNFGVSLNFPPVAGNDAFSGAEDDQATGNVLVNDFDAQPLSAVLETGPTSAASFTLNPDGSFIYVPLANFNGTDSFTYRAFDGALSSAPATVTLTITPVNDAPTATNGTLTVAEDSPATVVNLLTLLNASDIEGSLSLVSVETTSLGTGVVNADGSFQFTPAANANGADTLDVVISDGVAQITRTLTLTVTPVNDGPVATDDAASTGFQTTLVLPVATLLANDADIDGPALTVTAVGNATGGTVTLVAGEVTFIPTAGFTGQGGFDYTLSDGSLADTARVTVQVGNQPPSPPVGNADSFSGAEDTDITGNVLDNDSDIDSAELTAALVTGPTQGALVLNDDGSFTYTPNANYFGPDSFTYRANDGALDSAITTVSLTVTAVNDAPTATNAVLLASEDVGFSGNLLALLGATDIDGDDLDIVAVGPTALGSFTVDNETGAFTFTPTANANGNASIDVTLTDGIDTITRSVLLDVAAVNDAPQASNDGYATTAGQALVVAAAAGLLANDTDTEGSGLSAQLGTGPANGTLTLNGDGSFTYTPNAGFTGTDSFTYTASDGTALSAPATVTLSVAPAGGGSAPSFSFSQGFTGPLPTLQAGPAATPAELAALVRQGSAALDGTTYHLVENIGIWNALKNVALDSFDTAFGTAYAIANFVSVEADFSTAGTTALDLLVVGAKRSDLATAGGDDEVTLLLNSRSWGGNANRIDTAGGNDTVLVAGVGASTLDDQLLADNAAPGNGRSWNAAYQGGFDHAVTVNAGAGNDTVTVTGSFAARIFGGAGVDVLTGGSARDLLDGGADADTMTGGAGRDTFVLRAGETLGDAITDFTAGDVIRLVGFGAGATLASLGGGSFQAGGETFTVAGAATLVAGVDYIFA